MPEQTEKKEPKRRNLMHPAHIEQICVAVTAMAAKTGNSAFHGFLEFKLGDGWTIASNMKRVPEADYTPANGQGEWTINRFEICVFYDGWLALTILRNGVGLWVAGGGIEVEGLLAVLDEAIGDPE